MIKATNPLTRHTEIVTPEQADAMKRGIACRGYEFEEIEPLKAAEPPTVEPPEHLPTPPPAVNLPGRRFGTSNVTKAAKRRK